MDKHSHVLTNLWKSREMTSLLLEGSWIMETIIKLNRRGHLWDSIAHYFKVAGKEHPKDPNT